MEEWILIKFSIKLYFFFKFITKDMICIVTTVLCLYGNVIIFTGKNILAELEALVRWVFDVLRTDDGGSKTYETCVKLLTRLHDTTPQMTVMSILAAARSWNHARKFYCCGRQKTVRFIFVTRSSLSFASLINQELHLSNSTRKCNFTRIL